MRSPARVAVIGANTVREAIRNKLLYTLVFFALVLISTGFLLATLSYVERERIMQDVGLGAIRLFGVGIAIFLGVGLIHKEVDRRTIYTIVTKPVSRAEFLLGKFVGLVATVWLQLLIMSAAFVAVSLVVGAPIDGGHAAALLLTGMELMLIVAVATLFSAFTTPLLASMFTVGMYLVGHLTRDLRAIAMGTESPALKSAAQLVYWLLPDLEMFNRSIEAVHGLAIETGQVVWPLLYGMGYAACLLVLASIVFERRDFR